MIRQDILENHHKPIYLGIGSNLGDRVNNITKACYLISKFCVIIKISNLYESKSWPNEKFPKYLNIIVKCNTNLKAEKLLKNLKNIETKLGRKKNKKNYPRKCDIDIIDFKGCEHNNKKINLPHPRLTKRNFVLIPLFEIDKKWKYPKTDVSIYKFIKKLGSKSLRRINIFVN